MPDQPAGEKTEDATPKRRREARRRGMVARSPELSGAITFLTFVLLFPVLGGNLAAVLLEQMRGCLGDLSPAFADPGQVIQRVALHMLPVVWAVFPLLLIGLVIGLVVNFAQVGFVLSTEPLNPQMSRINPMEGFKRILSTRAIVEGAKAALKTIVIGYIAYSSIRDRLDMFQGIGGMPPDRAVATVAAFIGNVLLRIAAVWLVLAALDYYYQRKQMDIQLRMTKDEIKREMKETEQSPELKMALARRRAQLARMRMMHAVKTADAVVTNPTHFAVALKYDEKSMSAPQVIAKGRDLLAERIKEEARKWRVPIVPNPPLAQSLYKLCEVGDSVPYELYQAVAEVIAYVLSRRRRRRPPSR